MTAMPVLFRHDDVVPIARTTVGPLASPRRPRRLDVYRQLLGGPFLEAFDVMEDPLPLNNAVDTSLIAELRNALEDAGRAVAKWQTRALEALHHVEIGARDLAKAREQLAESERQVEQLTIEVAALRCGDLHLFHDGELDHERAEKFRAHLGNCQDCQTGLVDIAQLDAAMSTARPRGAR